MNVFFCCYSRFTSCLIGLFFVCIMNFAMASAPLLNATSKPHTWEFMVAPYAWLLGINGTITVRGNDTMIDTTPHDTLQALHKVNAIFQMHTEARHDKLSLLFDLTYLRLTQPVSFGTFGADIIPSMTLIDFGGFYTIASTAHFHGTVHPLELQLLGGGRHFRLGIKLRPRRLPNLAGDASFTAPIVGMRLMIPISNKLRFVIRGDVGGFNMGNATSTWSANILGFYRLNKCLDFAAGYRWQYMNFSQEEGAERVGMDAKLFGPVMGLVFRF